jgi:phosphoglycerate kinase
MTILSMTDINLAGKRVLIREDLNVPINHGVVTSDARIRAALPTIEAARKSGAKVILMSHLGRPTEGQYEDQFSLQTVANTLGELLGCRVNLIKDWQRGIDMDIGDIVLLENVRFNPGEESNDDDLAKAYASLCDVFVMDAFGTAHRAQASTHGVAKFAATACAGPLLMQELAALKRALANPERPVVAVVGGSKVSTKLTVLETLADKVDQLIVGGGIANTFLAAAGNNVGSSLCEKNLIDQAKRLMDKIYIPLPTDVIVGREYSSDANATLKSVTEIDASDMIFDIGPNTVKILSDILNKAKTIIWNGPVGVFEFDQFGSGTKAIAAAIANNRGFSIAGGGDTLAAIDKYGIAEKISYISTGGGAFLEYVEGKTLPAVSILQSRAVN